MQKVLITLCVTLLPIISACNHTPGQSEIHNVTKVLVDTVVPETYITGDTIYYDALYPTDICVIDTFVLVGQRKDENLIYVYDMRDTSLLGKFLKPGNGPDEVIHWNGFIQYWKEDGEAKILVQSYLQKVGILNINRSLEAKKAVFEKQSSFNKDSARAIMQRSNVAYMIGDQFLITRAPERTKGLKDYNPSLQWLDFEKDQPGNVIYTTNIKTINNPFLYIIGGTSLRPSGDKLCIACRFLNTFSILNISDGTVLQIFSKNEDLDTKAIADAHKSSIYYSAVTSTDDYLFLNTSRGADYDKLKETGTTIEVYDWKGSHIHRFLTTDIIYYMSIDATGHNLYAVVENGEMKRYSLVY
ncbi:MAG: BF3164 family lipoprotein [Bacteroides sp.]|nr:BF3164 family lipoprotein [Bacteroides sp.]